MTDRQTRIEELEKRAAESDLLALLATDQDVRIRTAQNARNFRLEALRLMTRRKTVAQTEAPLHSVLPAD